MGGCMGQLVGSGQMTNLIKLEFIDIIRFCLRIYDLWGHPYLWVDMWVNGWAHVKWLKSNKSWPNQDNSIMNILDILLDILLKPPQPLMGLFFAYIALSTLLPQCETIRPLTAAVWCSLRHNWNCAIRYRSFVMSHDILFRLANLSAISPPPQPYLGMTGEKYTGFKQNKNFP